MYWLIAFFSSAQQKKIIDLTKENNSHILDENENKSLRELWKPCQQFTQSNLVQLIAVQFFLRDLFLWEEFGNS